MPSCRRVAKPKTGEVWVRTLFNISGELARNRNCRWSSASQDADLCRAALVEYLAKQRNRYIQLPALWDANAFGIFEKAFSIKFH